MPPAGAQEIVDQVGSSAIDERAEARCVANGAFAQCINGCHQHVADQFGSHVAIARTHDRHRHHTASVLPHNLALGRPVALRDALREHTRFLFGGNLWVAGHASEAMLLLAAAPCLEPAAH